MDHSSLLIMSVTDALSWTLDSRALTLPGWGGGKIIPRGPSCLRTLCLAVFLYISTDAGWASFVRALHMTVAWSVGVFASEAASGRLGHPAHCTSSQVSYVVR